MPNSSSGCRRVIGMAAVLVASFAGSGSVSAAEPVAMTPLVLEVMTPPRPVEGFDGRQHLVYELRLTNTTPLDVKVTNVTVLDPATGAALFQYDAYHVPQRLAVGADRRRMGDTLAGGQFGVFFAHLAVGGPVPPRLAHRVAVDFAPAPDGLAITGGETVVATSAPPVLGPPLHGKGFLAGDGCCDTVRHVRALLPLNGAFTLAQRFAIDFEQLDETGRLYVGDRADVRSYAIYGEDILAVADGLVTAAVDGEPDQAPGAFPSNLPIEKADGNHVIQEVGGYAYALYAHMIPGSVRVKAGDRVTRGQVLGKVGNSGNSTAPHLHFHVVDGPSALASNGVRYVFERFAITGLDIGGTADFDSAESLGQPAAILPLAGKIHERQLPLDLTVVDWPNATP